MTQCKKIYKVSLVDWTTRNETWENLLGLLAQDSHRNIYTHVKFAKVLKSDPFVMLSFLFNCQIIKRAIKCHTRLHQKWALNYLFFTLKNIFYFFYNREISLVYIQDVQEVFWCACQYISALIRAFRAYLKLAIDNCKEQHFVRNY